MVEAHDSPAVPGANSVACGADRKGSKRECAAHNMELLDNGCPAGCKPAAFGHWEFESLWLHHRPRHVSKRSDQWGFLVLGLGFRLHRKIRGFDSAILHQRA